MVPPAVCDEETSCPGNGPNDAFFWLGGQDYDFGPEGEGICIERGMCHNPIPFQIGDLVDGDNLGRESVYLAGCGDRGGGAEVVYTFEAPADGDACFTVVDAEYDVVLYLKGVCSENPGAGGGWNLACADVAGVEPIGGVNERFEYALRGNETYYLVIDANDPADQGTFTLFSHYGACGAVPAPQCVTDADCGLGKRCTEQRQCITPIGTCEDPVEITDLGLYTASLVTARNQLDPARCDACVNPGGGRCAESVYRYRTDRGSGLCQYGRLQLYRSSMYGPPTVTLRRLRCPATTMQMMRQRIRNWSSPRRPTSIISSLQIAGLGRGA